MAGYNKFDPRLETLVVETRTLWAEELNGLTDVEKRAVARAIHQSPERASAINYERTHTGFIREVTVTPADFEQFGKRLASPEAGP